MHSEGRWAFSCTAENHFLFGEYSWEIPVLFFFLSFSLFIIHFFVSLAFLFLSFLVFRLGTKEYWNANKGLLPLEELNHFLRLSLHSVLNSWIEVSLLSNSTVTELLVQRGLGQQAHETSRLCHWMMGVWIFKTQQVSINQELFWALHLLFQSIKHIRINFGFLNYIAKPLSPILIPLKPLFIVPYEQKKLGSRRQENPVEWWLLPPHIRKAPKKVLSSFV